MENLKFRKKIFISFAIMITFTTIFSVIIMSKINTLKTSWDVNIKLTTVQELRNCINACGINTRDIRIMDEEDIKIRKGWINNAVEQYNKLSNQLETESVSKEDKDLLVETKKNADKYFAHLNNILNTENIHQISDEEMITFSAEEKSLFNNLDKIVENENKKNHTAILDGENIIKYIRVMSIVLIIGQLIITIVFGTILNINISKPMEILSNNLKVFSAGDFTIVIPEKFLKRKDEIGELSKAVNLVRQGLVDVVKEILNHSQNLNISSEELSTTVEEMTAKLKNINNSTEEIVNGTQETSSSAEEIAAAVEEVNSSISELSSKAMDGNNNAHEFKERAVEVQNKGKAAIEEIE
ncbi:MAG: methyl-accepting chemotaxis protein, partial [Clostridiaceae bacterium]